ncbi:DUF4874 domain-containing protein [Acaryochloris sp. 'Moss Beach']|uniref:DUF4874 domain-containing protein n=1 Tax=Acaryochloris sp. 'Moss Beach' TaxID=2740837 RepID=UPI001F20A28A|nr:DUF4874 domain-containing protein [Acaryochloris sp. 'Moss Beach']UJB72099.1 DUF4874 domain-containing protein [Acaryochloris sp. 'Moss Beach']
MRKKQRRLSQSRKGFFFPYNPWGTRPRPSLKLSELQKLRTQNITLARRIYLISEFRTKPLSRSFLNKVSADLSTARKSGIKLIIRFAYNWLGGGEDTSVDRIVSHLDQLEPLLKDNYDAIAYLEAGFIGYWGEWNRSTNGLRANPKARRKILKKIIVSSSR